MAALDPDRIILFGSRARGDARPDSDYDLLVVKDTPAGGQRYEGKNVAAGTGRIPRNARRQHRPVDILVETPERVTRLKTAIGTVFPDALKEGKLVYERNAE